MGLVVEAPMGQSHQPEVLGTTGQPGRHDDGRSAAVTWNTVPGELEAGTAAVSRGDVTAVSAGTPRWSTSARR